MADLDGDGYKEIICGAMGGVYVWRHDGTAFGQQPLFAKAGRDLRSSPVVCDLDGDGQPDVHFDMYYAEVKLGADFDLTALLTEEGSLNYGGITDSSYATYINDYLAADDLTRSSECYELLRYIAANAPIIPVCFERHEVITHRNVITGMEVTSSNVFYTITDWTITFSDEEQGD